jgi:hypothetical protein
MDLTFISLKEIDVLFFPIGFYPCKESPLSLVI